MKNKYLFLLLCLVCCADSAFCQTQFSLTFEENNLSIHPLSGNDSVLYDKIQFGDLQNIGEPGFPQLPVRYISLSVPSYVESFDLTIEDIQTVNLTLDHSVFPGQYPVPSFIDYVDKGFVAPDENVYSSVAPFPQNRLSIVSDGFLGGDKRVVTIAVYPVVYYPALQKLELSNYISLKITPKNSIARSIGSQKQVFSRNVGSSEDALKYVKSMVVNPEDVEGNVSSGNNTAMQAQSSVSSISVPFYEYCVITTQALSRSFERLVAWKREKGLNAGIVCLEDILNETGIAGDVVSNLYDDAGKIRGYLQQAFQNGGTRYVLFGGNNKVLPIRYGSGYNNTWYGEGDSIAAKIPTDLYFSDLNGNWNKDGDKYLGEAYGDAVDYQPELIVGRILCSTPEEVERYTTKLLKYEQNPGNGNFAYLKRAFYSQTDQMQVGREANIISEDMQSIFPEYSIVEEYPSYNDPNPTYPTGSIVIDSMNQNRSAFFGWFGHGHPGAISVRANAVHNGNYMGIIALQRENYHMVPEAGNGLDNLTNFDYPAIAYSIACTVTPFDVVNNFKVKYNIGESFTVGGLYGGPAFIGNTRFGWVTYSCKLQQEFDKQIKKGNYKIGVAEAFSRSAYSGYLKHWMALANNLIGCPEFEMWTDTPVKFNNLTVNIASSSVGVEVPGVDSATVSVRGLFGSNYVAKQIVSAQYSSADFTGLPQNTIITVNKHNYIPYVFPLFAQNENVSGFSYIHASDASFGKNVTGSKTQGDLIIKPGAEVIIEKSGIVSLEAGFEVEKGGVFEVK